MSAANELDPVTAAKVETRPRDAQVPPARAFPLAAIRETFEETGLMLGVKARQAAASAER